MAAGLLGALGGAALVLFALPSDLFGRVPTPSGLLSADPQHVAVIDGETLRLRETVIHLEGIRTPPRGQLCEPATDCGAAATNALATLVRDRTVACTLNGRDGTGYTKAMCSAGGEQINRALIVGGFAHASEDSGSLAADEAAARAGRRGLWRTGPF